MLAIRLSAEIEERLAVLAERTGRTKTFYARETIEKHIDDLEDLYLAESELAKVRAGRSINPSRCWWCASGTIDQRWRIRTPKVCGKPPSRRLTPPSSCS
jgi:RHH-type transcriptional regulator, rel operon repressor / antitoxin RelB